MDLEGNIKNRFLQTQIILKGAILDHAYMI